MNNKYDKNERLISYLEIKCSSLSGQSKKEVCSSIRYESKLMIDGYKKAIEDVKRYINNEYCLDVDEEEMIDHITDKYSMDG